MTGRVRFDLPEDPDVDEDELKFPSSQYANYNDDIVHGHRQPARREIPDSQESAYEADDDWAEEDPADEQCEEEPAEESAQDSVETVIIPGGAKLPPKGEERRVS